MRCQAKTAQKRRLRRVGGVQVGSSPCRAVEHRRAQLVRFESDARRTRERVRRRSLPRGRSKGEKAPARSHPHGRTDTGRLPSTDKEQDE